jgi:RNase H-fold protein (predicted Holliday junction resolvase)
MTSLAIDKGSFHACGAAAGESLFVVALPTTIIGKKTQHLKGMP